MLPAKRHGILAGTVFAFVTSWGELVVTLRISARGAVTLPRRIWDGVQDTISPSVATVPVMPAGLLALALALAGRRAR